MLRTSVIGQKAALFFRWKNSILLAIVLLEANHMKRIGRILAARAAHRCFLSLVTGVALIAFPAQSLFAASCSVVKHNPPTEADKAFLAADFAKAESLYKADVAAHPGDPDAISGLVRTLLREQKVLDAEEAVHAALDAAPKAANGSPTSAPLLTLLGEVKFRQGEPLEVEPIVIQSYKLDPCNPRTRLLFARYSEINSRFATARQQIGFAHQFDPEDPEIRRRVDSNPAHGAAYRGDGRLSRLAQRQRPGDRAQDAGGPGSLEEAGRRACQSLSPGLDSAARGPSIPQIRRVGWRSA